MSSGSISGSDNGLIYFQWSADSSVVVSGDTFTFSQVQVQWGSYGDDVTGLGQSGTYNQSVADGTYSCEILAYYTYGAQPDVVETITTATVTVSPPPPSYSAPAAPTLTAPTNASYVFEAPVTCTGTYNSTDGQAANARAMRFKVSGGTYQYWNASTSALQSTEVWNAVSLLPGSSGSFTIPQGALTEGDTYNWSMADQEAGENLQGTFATDSTFSVQAPPTVTVGAPTGTVTTAYPQVQWTATPAAGTQITASQVRVFTAAQYGASGFDPGTSAATWDSGVVAGSGNVLTVGVPLQSGTTYYFYVQVTETGAETSSWAYTSGTVSLDQPAAPTVTAIAGTTALGLPVATITIQGHDNLLPADDASFESSVGTWTAHNPVTSIVQATSWAADGTHSLNVYANQNPGGAELVAVNTAVPVTAGQTYTAMMLAGPDSNAWTTQLVVVWLNGSGGTVSTVTATEVLSTSGTTQFTVSGVAPPAAVKAQLQIVIENVTAVNLGGFFDEVGIFPGTPSVWTRGGLVGSAEIVVTRDDGQYVRGASLANPALMPASQILTVVDAEVVPTDVHTWTATGNVIVNSVVTVVSPPSAVSNAVALPGGQGWWEFDPTDLTTAVSAQMNGYNPQVTEQSTAHIVLGQSVPNVIASAMGGIDGSATFETFDAPTYQGLTSLLLSQKTVFISDPFGDNQGVSYVRFGPQPGGMSSGTGNKTKDAQLHPSTASGPHHELSVTWVAQSRPAV